MVKQTRCAQFTILWCRGVDIGLRSKSLTVWDLHYGRNLWISWVWQPLKGQFQKKEEEVLIFLSYNMFKYLSAPKIHICHSHIIMGDKIFIQWQALYNTNQLFIVELNFHQVERYCWGKHSRLAPVNVFHLFNFLEISQVLHYLHWSWEANTLFRYKLGGIFLGQSWPTENKFQSELKENETIYKNVESHSSFEDSKKYRTRVIFKMWIMWIKLKSSNNRFKLNFVNLSSLDLLKMVTCNCLNLIPYSVSNDTLSSVNVFWNLFTLVSSDFAVYFSFLYY